MQSEGSHIPSPDFLTDKTDKKTQTEHSKKACGWQIDSH